MIILDTHIFVWWVHKSPDLTERQIEIILRNEKSGLGVSSISCWEIAKLVEKKRLQLSIDIEQWFNIALSYPGVELVHLTPQIIVASTRLPGNFHKDPADQLIVATARVLDVPVLSADEKILKYQHVKKPE